MLAEDPDKKVSPGGTAPLHPPINPTTAAAAAQTTAFRMLVIVPLPHGRLGEPMELLSSLSHRQRRIRVQAPIVTSIVKSQVHAMGCGGFAKAAKLVHAGLARQAGASGADPKVLVAHRHRTLIAMSELSPA